MDAYHQALEYLYSFTDYEQKSGYIYSPDRFDLARVHRLLDLLGNPHRSFHSMHIAGTKGKGSTAAIAASILRQAGYCIALYTSPHLHTFRERIQVNGRLISVDDVIARVDRLRVVAPQAPQITTFELITALAFDYFAHQGVEWAVIEVGMGGRLDATNVITPAVSVITSISYDHMAYLGSTLAEIATEKAGIIKPGVPVVAAPQSVEAQQAITQVAAGQNAPLTLVSRDWQCENVWASTEGQAFVAWPAADAARRQLYHLPLLGQHQVVNATTALAAIEHLRVQGVGISEQAIQAGIQAVHWPGRLHILHRRPWIVVDGAHNGDSMEKLAAAVTELFSYQKLILVLGVSADKDIDRILNAILPVTDQVIVTQAHHQRAAKSEALAQHIAHFHINAQVVSADQALPAALNLAGENDLILATGSLFLVADFTLAWLKHSQQPLPPTDKE